MPVATVVEFDVTQARAALKPAEFFQNPDKPGNLEFCKFVILNIANGTRLILAVNHHGGEVHARIKVVPMNFIETGDASDLDSVIVDGDFHAIESVEYDPNFGTVRFNLPDTNYLAGLYVQISRNGQCNFRTA